MRKPFSDRWLLKTLPQDVHFTCKFYDQKARYMYSLQTGEGANLKSRWKREFGESAGNEIYSVTAHRSKFFGSYIGHRFSDASMLAHSKYGATLFAVERTGEIRINPGNDFVIDRDDTLFYICLTQEEDAMIIDDSNVKSFKSVACSVRSTVGTSLKCTSSMDGFKSADTASVQSEVFEPEMKTLSETKPLTNTTMGRTKIAFPPVSPYVGHSTPNMCHILEEKAQLCCLRLDRSCEHCRSTSAFHYNWPSPPIIISAEFAQHSLFNVMVPLRAHNRPRSSLHPIILLLEHSPENGFLAAISCFPMVYYMLGNMDGLDSLLNAGILRAHTVIILDRESSMYAEEEYMADARQLVATQTMFRLFPTIPTCLELTHSSNMRFMHFDPPGVDIDPHEFRKEREKEKSCSLPYLFRKAFASGKVFSSSMLDTLLYQSFVKDYLTTLLRIMLGLQYTAGSGYLSTYKVTEKDVGKTYHEMFRMLTRKNACVVLGIYRYEDEKRNWSSASSSRYSTNESKHTDVISVSKDDQRTHSTLDEPVTTGVMHKRKSLTGSVIIGSMKKSIRSKFISSKRHNLQRLHLIESSKSQREKLDEMIQWRMKELQLRDRDFGSPRKSRQRINRFGYVLLNPSPDVLIQEEDILYIINPELNTSDSRSSSCVSEHTDDNASCEELVIDVPTSQDSGASNVSFKRENDLSRKLRRISAIEEESNKLNDDVIVDILETETSKI